MNATASGAIRDCSTVVIEAAIDIARPVRVVFGYCSDHRNEIEWNPAVRRVAKTTQGPVGAETRYEMEFRMETKSRGPLRAALPLLRRRMPRNLERDIAIIKDMLESPAAPRPPRPDPPANSPGAALRAIEAIHTMAWFSIEACVLYVLYAGFARRSDRRAGIAAAVVAAECLIFAGNGFRCPLTQVAEHLGAERGSVTDIYLPRWFAATFPSSTSR